MRDVTYLKKTGFNAHFKYYFASDEDVLAAIHAAFVEHGLTFSPAIVDVVQTGDKTLARFEMTIADAETGEEVTRPWYGEAQDKQDKGVSKAATSGTKYFLLKTFLIATGDKEEDPDAGAGAEHKDGEPSEGARLKTPPKETTCPSAEKALALEIPDKGIQLSDVAQDRPALRELMGHPNKYVQDAATFLYRESSWLTDELLEVLTEGLDKKTVLPRLNMYEALQGHSVGCAHPKDTSLENEAAWREYFK